MPHFPFLYFLFIHIWNYNLNMCWRWPYSYLVQFFHLWQGISYFLLTLGLELLPFHKWNPVAIKRSWKSIRNLWHDTSSDYLDPLLKSPLETDARNLDEDIDVDTERNRVLSGSIDNAIIYLRNLQKVVSIFGFHNTYVHIILILQQSTVVL